MKTLKILLASTLVILVILCLFSCHLYKDDVVEKTIPEPVAESIVPEDYEPPEEVDGEKNYNEFLLEFEKEGLKQYGIDVEQILAEYLNNITDITEVEYEVKKCNLTGNGDSDLCLYFSINHEWYKQNVDILCVYAFDNNRYSSILFENHRFINYEMVEILGNGRQQLILYSDDTGNSHTRVDMKILTFYGNGFYNTIFDEIAGADAAFPFKDVEGEYFYSVSYHNKHEFVDGTGNAKDIIFSSEIFEQEGEILKTGSSRFVYNGSKYVTNEYYDYYAEAKEIYENK